MKMRILIGTVALASAVTVAMATPAFAQSASNIVGAADNTNSNTFPMWMADQSKKNQGRLSRQGYMDESGRRWDAMDKTKQGLTMEDLNRVYGYGPNTTTIVGAADNTNSQSFPSWMTQQTAKNNGRVSRQMYMDETARRWDESDKTKSGLTTDEVNRVYGFATTPALPLKDGPGSVKK